ncbi:type II secretion system ATPase GspE [Candidatus Protochlamydia phocaeensis]|uniref:type II secretion system ATPase GspE n=1 Tax=Candidatus Protochlamydia phocaeensis TaxID=1414722 RepID=UPI0009ABF2B0|nr:type II secretion system ATPase GspE [Candidatus Protochlamydia phocaeensis]
MTEGNGIKQEQLGEGLALQGMLGGDAQASLAEQLGMAIYPDLSDLHVSKERYKQVSYAFAKKHIVLPIKDDGSCVTVAIADPLNLASLEELRFLFDSQVEAVYSPREVILSAIHDCYNTEDGAASQLIADLTGRGEDGRDGDVEVFDLLDHGKHQSPIIQLLNLILTEAIQQGASDIHFEPSENGMRVRYRIDGVLQNRHAPSLDYQVQLLTRIKVMSKLDIAEHRLPQDGRIKLRMGRREIDFRVSTVPIAGGERIVLRILDKGNVLLGLDKIGMLPSVFEQFKRLIDLPEGIVLVTGPTGSGKTTTLYSAICEMANDEINIMTIEDPVEYNLKGIAQIGVHHKIKLDFATGLRHILRQDPDVIMVGEIRDKETAEIAIQAALTGHLVLSTLHTNDAPSAITRLVDMGIEPYLLSSCIVGVLAQRLVRRICPECKEAYQPSERELQSLGIKPETLVNGCLYRGKGCSYCYGTGFKGRQGVYELMPVNNAINKQIVQSPDAVEMRRVALGQGMISLLGHGAELVRSGQSTVAEVLRVARGIEEQG